MQDISVGLVSSLPVIVVGPIGSGKSHLIHLIASITRNKLVSYQLSCETDAACLIGPDSFIEDVLDLVLCNYSSSIGSAMRMEIKRLCACQQ